MSKKKMKIKKSIARRFRITKNGKVLRRGAHSRHLRRKKSKSLIRAQKKPLRVDKAWSKKVKKLMGK